jgi:hypothetical protein
MYWFSLQVLSETFLILGRISRDIVLNVQILIVKYQLFLSDFNETWIFSTDFRKKLNYQIAAKSVQRESSCFMRTAGQTEGHDGTIVAFRNFANATKNGGIH